MGCAKGPHGGGEYFWISARNAKMLIFLYFEGVRVKKGQKRPKMAITFCFFVWGYGVCQMTARVWGLFLDIRTTRQNAYFSIFEGVKTQKRVKKGQKSPKKSFLCLKQGGV